MEKDAILVLDFGGQYCHLIARRVRENGVYSEIAPSSITVGELSTLRKKSNIKGIILSGGPSSIYDHESPQMDKKILDLDIPILGICYGHQLLASYLDGEVKRSKNNEYGTAFVYVSDSSGILKGLGEKEQVWMSHGDSVLSAPKGFEVLASTDNCPIAAFSSDAKRIYGVQWHPEVVHTLKGNLILQNFIYGICKCKSSWDPSNLVDTYIGNIRKEAGKSRVILALSGGIDSTTAAVLANRAIGDRLTAVFVDSGLMRKNETEDIMRIAEKAGINMIVADAQTRFLDKLKDVEDPEEKRKIIGNEFIRVFEETAEEVKAEYLLQGTIYPDRIESGHSKHSSVIKTHHNVGGLPKDMKFKGLIEPLKDLYKDEVRKIATELKLPREIVYRQAFPGPGLAVRIVGAITDEKLRIVRDADFIVTSEFEKAGSNEGLWEYFAVLTDTKSTGVKGDARAYGNVIAIRAVESVDAMTANFAKIPYQVLEKISTRITNEIPEVVRVVYDITNKPPSTIEWE